MSKLPSLYKASLAITEEKLKTQKSKMSATRIRTKAYLRRINKDTPQDQIDQLVLRYK